MADKIPSWSFFNQLALVPYDFRGIPSFKTKVLVYLPGASQGLFASSKVSYNFSRVTFVEISKIAAAISLSQVVIY